MCVIGLHQFGATKKGRAILASPNLLEILRGRIATTEVLRLLEVSIIDRTFTEVGGIASYICTNLVSFGLHQFGVTKKGRSHFGLQTLQKSYGVALRLPKFAVSWWSSIIDQTLSNVKGIALYVRQFGDFWSQ